VRQSGFNVHTKMAFGGPNHILKYLARYSHRVAITNQRILEVNEQSVSFSYKVYRDGKKKILKLTPQQFTQRFLLHVVPKGFAKIRHYGILSNRNKTNKIGQILQFFEIRKPNKKIFSIVLDLKQKYNVEIGRCPACHQGILLSMVELSPSHPICDGPSLPVIRSRANNYNLVKMNFN
jgi:hypothetical protein